MERLRSQGVRGRQQGRDSGRGGVATAVAREPPGREAAGSGGGRGAGEGLQGLSLEQRLERAKQDALRTRTRPIEKPKAPPRAAGIMADSDLIYAVKQGLIGRQVERPEEQAVTAKVRSAYQEKKGEERGRARKGGKKKKGGKAKKERGEEAGKVEAEEQPPATGGGSGAPAHPSFRANAVRQAAPRAGPASEMKCGRVSVGDVAVGILHRSTVAKKKAQPTNPPANRARARGAQPPGGRQDLPANAAPADQLRGIKATWLTLMPHATVFKKTVGARRSDLLKMAGRLRKLHPRKAWYLLVHDDTYVFVKNLLCHLDRQDSRAAQMTGMTHCLGPNFKCKSGHILYDPSRGTRAPRFKTGWLNGGAGIVISNKLAKKMRFDKCMDYYENLKAWSKNGAVSDVALACCAQDAGGEVQHQVGFTAGKPGFQECHCKKYNSPKCSLPGLAGPDKRISFHHVSPAMMQHLHGKQQGLAGHTLGAHVAEKSLY